MPAVGVGGAGTWSGASTGSAAAAYSIGGGAVRAPMLPSGPGRPVASAGAVSDGTSSLASVLQMASRSGDLAAHTPLSMVQAQLARRRALHTGQGVGAPSLAFPTGVGSSSGSKGGLAYSAQAQPVHVGWHSQTQPHAQASMQVDQGGYEGYNAYEHDYAASAGYDAEAAAAGAGSAEGAASGSTSDAQHLGSSAADTAASGSESAAHAADPAAPSQGAVKADAKDDEEDAEWAPPPIEEGDVDPETGLAYITEDTAAGLAAASSVPTSVVLPSSIAAIAAAPVQTATGTASASGYAAMGAYASASAYAPPPMPVSMPHDAQPRPLPLAGPPARTAASQPPPMPALPVLCVGSSDFERGALMSRPDPACIMLLYPKFRCKVCGERYGEQSMLAQHVQAHRVSIPQAAQASLTTMREYCFRQLTGADAAALAAGSMGPAEAHAQAATASGSGAASGASASGAERHFSRRWFAPPDGGSGW